MFVTLSKHLSFGRVRLWLQKYITRKEDCFSKHLYVYPTYILIVPEELK